MYDWGFCVWMCHIKWWGVLRWAAGTKGVRLTSCGRDVDVNADLRNAPALQRRHAGVCAKVGKLEVNDVQVGGPWWDVGVRLSDDHTFWAPQGTTVLQPVKHQLLRRCRLHLWHRIHCYLGFIDSQFITCMLVSLFKILWLFCNWSNGEIIFVWNIVSRI